MLSASYLMYSSESVKNIKPFFNYSLPTVIESRLIMISTQRNISKVLLVCPENATQKTFGGKQVPSLSNKVGVLTVSRRAPLKCFQVICLLCRLMSIKIHDYHITSHQKIKGFPAKYLN